MKTATLDRLQIFNADCMDLLGGFDDNAFDLAIVDPPYFTGPNQSGYYGKGYSTLGVKRASYYEECKHWEIPTITYFEQLKRISKNQIIWGANHFAGLFDASSPCWIVWDKENGKSSFADVELAYTSFSTAARLFKYMWMGMHQGSMGGDVSKNEKRIHPTQKPTALYKWLLENYAKPGDQILDTHLGSGSSAIAAHYFDCDFTGIEKDEHYFDVAVERIANETKQLEMVV